MTRIAAFLLGLLVGASLHADDAPEWVCVQQHGNASLWIQKREGTPPQVKLSEVLTVVMRVEGKPPLAVEFSEKLRSTEGWHLERVGAPTTAADPASKSTRWEQTFKATPLQPGAHPLPLPALQFTEQEEAPRDVAWTPLALVITTRVAKVDISEARDLAPIEEVPATESASHLWWPWLLAGAPVMAALAWLLLGRRSRHSAVPTPRDMALTQLDELAGFPTEMPADVYRLHALLSDVLRRYLEQHFDLPAQRRTTAEFFAALAQHNPLAPEQQQLLRDILDRCDLAKFAGVCPQAEACRVVVGWARDFVKDVGRGL